MHSRKNMRFYAGQNRPDAWAVQLEAETILTLNEAPQVGLTASAPGTRVPVQPGEWLVKDEDTGYESVITLSDFNSHYELFQEQPENPDETDVPEAEPAEPTETEPAAAPAPPSQPETPTGVPDGQSDESPPLPAS